MLGRKLLFELLDLGVDVMEVEFDVVSRYASGVGDYLGGVNGGRSIILPRNESNLALAVGIEFIAPSLAFGGVSES
jgi:hypothetical protein